MIKSGLRCFLSFTIFLMCLAGLYAKASAAYFAPLVLSSPLQYSSSNHFLKYSSNYLFRNFLFYQNLPSITEESACDFVSYGDNLEIRWITKQVFGSLPDHIPHLLLAQNEEDFPIQYWVYKSASEAQRHLIDQTVEETNAELGFRAFMIVGADFGEMNSIDSRKDQRNVIYLLSEEEMSTQLSGIAYTSDQTVLQGPGATIRVPNLDVSHDASFYSIMDADIMINKDFVTDLGAFRSHLITHLKQVGIENPPLDVDVAYLHNLLIEHLENVDAEEYRSLVTGMLMQERQSLDAIRDEIGLTEEEKRAFDQELARIDGSLSLFLSAEPLQLLWFARNFRANFTSVDVSDFQESSSSILFRNILKHELLHGLGLDHYTGIIVSDSKPLMKPSILDFFGENAFVSSHVDFYALRSLGCIYNLDNLRQRFPL